MNIKLKAPVRHILILGAGASNEYGLPTWSELHSLAKIMIEKDKTNQYKYKKEMLDWLGKVGEGNRYKTIDECIMHESVLNDSNGAKVENELFGLIKDIFEDMYQENESGWIKGLNDKVKDNVNLYLESRMAFINYNYDDVLNKNFLNFDRLPEKNKLKYRDRLNFLSGLRVDCLCPHGFFPSGHDLNSSVYRQTKTFKTDIEEDFWDVVSCYESKEHNIVNKFSSSMSLYILGLGGGLETNLNKIKFENEISTIHITIKNLEKQKQTIGFLSKKFDIEAEKIEIYSDCKELIDKCF